MANRRRPIPKRIWFTEEEWHLVEAKMVEAEMTNFSAFGLEMLIAWLQSDARQSAGKGCLSGICRGRETHSYNDRSCRGGNTSTALLCRYGMTLDLLFESVNGNIIIRMRNRP